MCTILAILTLALPVSSGAAGGPQVGRIWSFAELMNEAELVLIADRGETQRGGTVDGVDGWRLPMVVLRTPFRTQVVLKAPAGAAWPAEVIVRHYRIDLDEWRRRQAPEPGTPPPSLGRGPRPLDLANAGVYLLFLARTETGAYEPVSGHTFPSTSAYPLSRFPGR